MALNPPAAIDRRGKQPLRNFDGSFASAYPSGNKPEPSSSFAEGNEITITSADAGFTFGEKTQAAPIFLWRGRDVWVNGVYRDDYNNVSAGDPVPLGDGQLFRSGVETSKSNIVFSSEVRDGLPGISVQLVTPDFFGSPLGHSSDIDWDSAYFSWRTKLEAGYSEFWAFEYTSITGEFIPGESFYLDALDGSTRTSGGVIHLVNSGQSLIQVTDNLAFTSGSDRDGGTLVGETSGATAVLTAVGYATVADKPHRFVADVTNGFSSVSNGNRYWSAVDTTIRYFEDGSDGTDSGYFDSSTLRWDSGEWDFVEVSAVLNRPTGYSYMGTNNVPPANRQYSNFIDTSTITFLNAAPQLNTFGVDGTGGADQLIADIFIADLYFDLTNQRVFVSNSSTYSAVGKAMELQLPTAWSDSSLTFRCIEGVIDTAQPIYAYIVDQNNYVNGVDVNAYESTMDVNGILIGGAS